MILCNEELMRVSGVPCSYFAQRFPQLLLATFAFAGEHCKEEPQLSQYLPACSMAAFTFAKVNIWRHLTLFM